MSRPRRITTKSCGGNPPRAGRATTIHKIPMTRTFSVRSKMRCGPKTRTAMASEPNTIPSTYAAVLALRCRNPTAVKNRKADDEVHRRAESGEKRRSLHGEVQQFCLDQHA